MASITSRIVYVVVDTILDVIDASTDVVCPQTPESPTLESMDEQSAEHALADAQEFLSPRSLPGVRAVPNRRYVLLIFMYEAPWTQTCPTYLCVAFVIMYYCRNDCRRGSH